jgi:hypothetical protein
MIMALRERAPAPDNVGCGCRIPTEEILQVLGLPHVAPAAGLWRGAHVAPDWRGRPSVTVADAAAIVDAFTSAADAETRKRQAEELAREAAETSERLAEEKRPGSFWGRGRSNRRGEIIGGPIVGDGDWHGRGGTAA